MKRITKKEILYKLNERDYMRKLHREIKESLVGVMFNDYLMKGSTTPNFHAVVDMLVANLLNAVSSHLIDEVWKAIEEIQKIKKGS